MDYDEYRGLWEKKTVKQIEKEIESMRRYMQRHNSAYNWHGKSITPPGSLADGDRLSALREALAAKIAGIEIQTNGSPSPLTHSAERD